MLVTYSFISSSKQLLPSFADEKTEAQRGFDLPEATQWQREVGFELGPILPPVLWLANHSAFGLFIRL